MRYLCNPELYVALTPSSEWYTLSTEKVSAQDIRKEREREREREREDKRDMLAWKLNVGREIFKVGMFLLMRN